MNGLHFRHGKMDLLLHHCRCGELNVLGFHHQLTWVVDRVARKATTDVTCGKCGAECRKTYRLTTARRKRRRMIDWFGWAWWLVSRVPWSWRWWIIRPAIWLERRVRV